MSHEIDFLLCVFRPEIDGEDEVRGIYITVGDENSALIQRWLSSISEIVSKAAE